MTMAKFKPKHPLAAALGKLFGTVLGFMVLFTWVFLKFVFDAVVELAKLAQLFIVALFIGGGLTAGAVLLFAFLKYQLGV